MKAAPIKSEAKWPTFNLTFEDIPHFERNWDIGSSSFLSGLLYRNFCDVSIPTAVKPSWESQITLSPVPHPMSSALHGAIGVVVTV
jgi:hypothetical protein